MTTLVTGGLGTNGSWIVRKLVEEGDGAISLDNAGDQSLVQDIKDRVIIENGDLLDLGNFIRILKKHDVDSIVHSAALLGPKVQSLRPGEADPVAAFEVNGKGTLNVLEAAISADVRRVVYISSKGVYAEPAKENSEPAYKPISEDYPRKASTIYGLFKGLGEELGNLYSEIYGIEFVSLRYAAIYGPGRIRTGTSGTKPRRFTSKDILILNALQNIPTRIIDDGRKDELIYVRDVAKSALLALKAEKLMHNAYHFGGGGFVTIGEYAEAVRKRFPAARIEIEKQMNHSDSNAASAEYVKKRFIFDTSRAKEELGYVADYSLERGIDDYIEWVRKH